MSSSDMYFCYMGIGCKIRLK